MIALLTSTLKSACVILLNAKLVARLPNLEISISLNQMQVNSSNGFYQMINHLLEAVIGSYYGLRC
jgi:hypothetical protein